MMLQLSDGSLIMPLSVFDVLDTVEEYLGTEVRQYLEEYLHEENPWENLPDSEKVDLLLDHYQAFFDGIGALLSEVHRLMHQSPKQRREAIEKLETVKKMIEKENENIRELD